MSRAHVPAAPADDLAARRVRPDPGALTPDLAAFVQSGVSVVLGASDGDRRPIAGIALAARVEGETVRILLRRPANEALLAAVEAGSPLAATFSRPVDHRAIQLKARGARIVALAPDDAGEAALQCAVLRDALIEVGYTPAFSRTYVAFAPHELAALAFSPDRAFVQTPGPGAGSELARSAAGAAR